MVYYQVGPRFNNMVDTVLTSTVVHGNSHYGNTAPVGYFIDNFNVMVPKGCVKRGMYCVPRELLRAKPTIVESRYPSPLVSLKPTNNCGDRRTRYRILFGTKSGKNVWLNSRVTKEAALVFVYLCLPRMGLLSTPTSSI